MTEFDKDVHCGNCGLCRIDSRDYFGRCSRCGEREWESIVEDKWLGNYLEELEELNSQDTEELKIDDVIE